MGYLGRRIGLSQGRADAGDPQGGDTGGGLLDLFTNGYFQREGNIFNAPGVTPSSGLTATGGIISDYPDGGSNIYRAHIFTSSGTFEVTALATGGDITDNLEYLVVGGGGGGGGESAQAGGGGAGGFRTNLTGHPVKAADYTAEIGTYTVTVGAGGQGGLGPNPSGGQLGSQGGNSEFFPAPVNYPSTKRVRSVGGGGGMGYNASPVPGMNGGSGGGANNTNSTTAGGTAATDPNHPQIAGYAGGGSEPAYGSPYAGGGGGGAGRVGAPDNPSTPLTRSTGGYGLQALIAGPPANPQPIGAPGPGSGAAATGYFAGGGGGGAYSAGGAAGGYGGGADGGGTNIPSKNGPSAAASTGGGGGGAAHVSSSTGRGGNGGSGVVVVRYKIASIQTAKATGGAVTFYNNKTIHTFTSSGTFATEPNWSSATVDYLVVGGGAAGGSGGPGQFGGGGGGAGAVRIGTTPIGAHPVSTTIQVGAGGASVMNDRGGAGTDSYFGTPITAAGGGGGGGKDPADPGGPGGSGGGAKHDGSTTSGGTGSGDDYPGSPPDASPSNGWGNDGGPGSSGGGGGGGGAGSTGSNSPGGYTGGPGGTGIQIPSTFYDPAKSTIGFPGASGVGWIAGGGGGSTYGNPNSGGGGGGGAAAGEPALGYAGAGWGQKNYSPGDPVQPLDHGNAKANSGSGGGGNNNGRISFEGGSGLVLIAYPT